jgi:predicted nucleotidyltransferase
MNARKITPILLCVAGSRAYGTNTETSDYDLRGVMVPEDFKNAYYGIYGTPEQVEYGDGQLISELPNYIDPALHAKMKECGSEGVIYELRKFFRLLADCNPNIMDLVFTNSHLYVSPVGVKILEARGLFVSAKAKHTYSGYATSQLNRIKTHRKWLLSPVEEKPRREDFGLIEYEMPQDVVDQHMAMIQKQMDTWELDLSNVEASQRVHIKTKMEETLNDICTAQSKFSLAAHYVGIGGATLEILLKEKEYRDALREYNNYQNWKKNRNAARAELERKSGYDTKHAMHLVRLLRMGREILTTGQVLVDRRGIDADELVAIRNGHYTYDQIVEMADGLHDEVRSLYDKKEYVVPGKSNMRKINELLVECMDELASQV